MGLKLAHFIMVLMVSPFLFGVVNRTKAFFAGRHGSPFLQMYYDIFKLFRKGAVYSTTTTGIFKTGPIIGFGAILTAALLIPFGGHPALLAFDGDLILLIYLFALARFFMVLAALDTGSSFEGMGSSREVQFAVFAEPALFLSLAALARITGHMSLSGIFGNSSYSWAVYGPTILLITGSLFIVFLTENSRMPVDDPNTHLELTMIHEVMVLDHGGVDLAYILYTAALKFWILGSLVLGSVVGAYDLPSWMQPVLFFPGMMVLAIVVGIIESTLTRLRLLKVPHFLVIALSLSIVAFILTMKA